MVYSDDKAMAFMDTNPVNFGHVLVIPKVHVESMAKLDEETWAHLFRITIRIAKAVRKSGVKCEGINLFVADGKVASQDVFHFHVHIIPRFEGDGFAFKANTKRVSRKELDKIAIDIRKVLEK